MLLPLVVVACAAPEVLPSRDGTVPSGVDFSGNWQIQSNQREDQQRLRQAIRRTDGISDDDLFRRPNRDSTDRDRRSRSSSVKGGLVFVFLETGSSLKVTQTEYGLFISFDRSVVEEYRFGENRFINVGEVEAQRVTGWEGNQLVIDTLDKNSMKMTERLELVDSRNVLERTITFRSKEGEEETVVQRFDRQS
ncbi:MAG: hypothetical protein ACR2QR_00585 [Woeseiaceae bacterium]